MHEERNGSDTGVDGLGVTKMLPAAPSAVATTFSSNHMHVQQQRAMQDYQK